MALSPRIFPFLWELIYVSKWKWLYTRMNLPMGTHFNFKMRMTLYQNESANGNSFQFCRKSFSEMTFAKWVMIHFGWWQKSFWSKWKWVSWPKWKCWNENKLILKWNWNDLCRPGTLKWLLQNESGFILQNENGNVEMSFVNGKVIFILQNEIEMTLSPPPWLNTVRN